MRTVGLDIGGANLKAADAEGRALVRAFPVWKDPQGLAGALAEVVAEFAPVDRLAVTMTAELADCFETKAEGVAFILNAVEAAVSHQSEPHRPPAACAPLPSVHVWQTGGEFVSPELAREVPLLVAAANWHALATWLGRTVPTGAALLIDVGSTTTDVIPLSDGVPLPGGRTDRERLQTGELVYSGVRRTPVCAIAHSVPFRDGYCPLAAEWFATTLDVYLLLGDQPEDAADCDTVNGRPATKTAACDRLARAVCCDRTEFTAADAEVMARFLADVQRQRLSGAVSRVVDALGRPPTHVLLSGSGAFLAERVAREHPRLEGAARISVAELLSGPASAAACAVAVARLAAERL